MPSRTGTTGSPGRSALCDEGQYPSPPATGLSGPGAAARLDPVCLCGAVSRTLLDVAGDALAGRDGPEPGVQPAPAPHPDRLPAGHDAGCLRHRLADDLSQPAGRARPAGRVAGGCLWGCLEHHCPGRLRPAHAGNGDRFCLPGPGCFHLSGSARALRRLDPAPDPGGDRRLSPVLGGRGPAQVPGRSPDRAAGTGLLDAGRAVGRHLGRPALHPPACDGRAGSCSC